MISRYFPQIAELPRSRQVLTDVEGSWAEPEIQNVVGVGLLDPMPNHELQPARTLNRIELAQAMYRLSRLVEVTPPTGAGNLTPEAVPATRPQRDSEWDSVLSLIVAGDPADSDLPAPVSGQEAVNAAEKLLRFLREKAN